MQRIDVYGVFSWPRLAATMSLAILFLMLLATGAVQPIPRWRALTIVGSGVFVAVLATTVLAPILHNRAVVTERVLAIIKAHYGADTETWTLRNYAQFVSFGPGVYLTLGCGVGLILIGTFQMRGILARPNSAAFGGSDDARAKNLRAAPERQPPTYWENWWFNRSWITQKAIKILMIPVCAVGMFMFLNFESHSSTGTGNKQTWAPGETVIQMGAPDPWWKYETGPTRFQFFVNIFSGSFLAGVVAVWTVYADLRIYRWEKRRQADAAAQPRISASAR
jgi:hypothetical protein